MKKPLYLFFILALGLFSCSKGSAPVPDDTIDNQDYLIYVIGGIGDDYGVGRLMFYDPIQNTHISILPDWIIGEVTISEENRLAFSSNREGNGEIYILDYSFTDNIPLNITHDPYSEDHPISWSPDGRYLAYESIQANGKTLNIWDGKTALQVHRYQGAVDELAWSFENRLAFTEFDFLHDLHKRDFAEVFIWDGETTTNVSQNPSGEDRYPVWNADGRLAFSSHRNGKFGIYVANGISANDGKFNMNTFINVAPNLTDGASSPAWVSNSSLVFGTMDSQYYEWDGQSVTKLCQKPASKNGDQSWMSSGYWFFAVDCSNDNLVYVQGEKNQPLLISKGYYPYPPPALSSSGLLLFCDLAKDLPGFELLQWDGKKIIKIVQGPTIQAVWRNGNGVFCTSG